MEIVDILFRSIFLGFTVWTVFWVLTKREQLFGHGIVKIDDVVVQTTMVWGILHFILIISELVEMNDESQLDRRAFGKYWFGFWMYPLTYFGLTQLLWIDRIRKSKVARVLLALWVFAILHLEKFVIIVTSLHRDFSPEGGPWYMLPRVVLGWFIDLAIFFLVVVVLLRVRKAVLGQDPARPASQDQN